MTMDRTRLIFFVIIGVALLVVVCGLAISLLPRITGSLGPAPTPTPTPNPAEETLEVRVVCALPVEPWITEAARQFNAEGHTLEGHPIHVEIIPMDGLAAMGRYEREEFGTEENPYPTAWIPDNRYLVELVNATYKDLRGRDVFLTDGEYRARPIAVSLFAWGIYASREEVLREKYGEIDWHAIHDAATAKGGWPGGAQPAQERRRTGGNGRRRRRVPRQKRHRRGGRDRSRVSGVAGRTDGGGDRFLQPGSLLCGKPGPLRLLDGRRRSAPGK